MPDPALNLLPREMYAEVMRQKGQLPHFEIERKGQVLFFFGANHSRDPQNEQYPKIRRYWNRYLEMVDRRQALVLIEGSLRDLVEDEEQAILRGGESCFASLLAYQEGVPVACPEPEPHEHDRILLESFSREEIALYYFENLVCNWQRLPEDRRRNLDEHCEESRRLKVWGFSAMELKEIHRQVLGFDFCPIQPLDLCNPNNESTVVNRVARVSSDIRDAHIAREILRYWREGRSPFIIFGSGHLVIQEPALRSAIDP